MYSHHNSKTLLEPGEYDPKKITDIQCFTAPNVFLESNRRLVPGTFVFADYKAHLIDVSQLDVGGVADEDKINILADLDRLVNVVLLELEKIEEYVRLANMAESLYIKHSQEQFPVDQAFYFENSLSSEDYDARTLEIKNNYESKLSEIKEPLKVLIGLKKYQFEILDFDNVCDLIFSHLIERDINKKFCPRDIFESRFNDVIEKPCRKLVKYLVENGCITTYSNAFGPGLKGVWWNNPKSEQSQSYFISLETHKTYYCKEGVGEDGFGESGRSVELTRQHMHSQDGLDFSSCWPTLEDFNTLDLPSNVQADSKEKFMLCVYERIDNTPSNKL